MTRRRLAAAVLASLVASASASAALPRLPCADSATPAAPPLPRGVVSIVAKFGADPTGKADSTAALQAAFTAARTDNVTLFVPLGCFKLTDTVTAEQPRNGRWQPVVVVGQTPPAGTPPPTFFLPPSSAGFDDPEGSKPLLHFITNWCLEPGAGVAVPALGCSTAAQPPGDWHSSAYQFNQVLQGVDLILGEGNPSVIGVDMNAAQGTTIEDVTVYAGAILLSSLTPFLLDLYSVLLDCTPLLLDLTVTSLHSGGRPVRSSRWQRRGGLVQGPHCDRCKVRH